MCDDNNDDSKCENNDDLDDNIGSGNDDGDGYKQ